jgi:hypothetical protein
MWWLSFRAFRDYRLRVATVLRDYGMRSRDDAPREEVERQVSNLLAPQALHRGAA